MIVITLFWWCCYARIWSKILELKLVFDEMDVSMCVCSSVWKEEKEEKLACGFVFGFVLFDIFTVKIDKYYRYFVDNIIPSV